MRRLLAAVLVVGGLVIGAARGEDPPAAAYIPKNPEMRERTRDDLTKQIEHLTEEVKQQERGCRDFARKRADLDKFQSGAAALPTADALGPVIAKLKAAVDDVSTQIDDAGNDEGKLRTIKLTVIDVALDDVHKLVGPLYEAIGKVTPQFGDDDTTFPVSRKEIGDDAAKSLRNARTLLISSPVIARERIQTILEHFPSGDAVRNDMQNDLDKVMVWVSTSDQDFKKELEDNRKKLAASAAQLKALIEVMDKDSKSALNDMLSLVPNSDKFVFPLSILFLILLIPVLVGLLKRFETTVQVKMIENRFLIEILSIALLIVAIIILGTAGKLLNEALGTLLGTVSGYVLSRNFAERLDTAVTTAQKKILGVPEPTPLTTTTPALPAPPVPPTMS